MVGIIMFLLVHNVSVIYGKERFFNINEFFKTMLYYFLFFIKNFVMLINYDTHFLCFFQIFTCILQCLRLSDYFTTFIFITYNRLLLKM